MNRIPRPLRITGTVVLLALGLLGVTNAQHLTAKIGYAVLIAVAGAGLALTARFHRR